MPISKAKKTARGEEMIYHFKIHKERDGTFWSECLELEGCQTQGDTKEELFKNMENALNLFLSEPPDSKYIFPRPKKAKKSSNIIGVQVSPMVAIANLIRELRIKHELTQNQMKDFLGIKYLSAYQRLEDPERSNPEWKTLAAIQRKFPDFKLDGLTSVND